MIMKGSDNILDMLKDKGAEAVRNAHRGLILQPGAIGDCILTLPLAGFMKKSLGLGSVDILGRTEYISILPGRTCVNGVRSMDSLELHRLFISAKEFDVADGDALINFFADYCWIVTFLGEPYSDFEQNLIYTVNCSHSGEVITLPMKPPAKFKGHLSDFYAQQFVEQCGMSLKRSRPVKDAALIKATKNDIKNGKELLKEFDVKFSGNLVVLHPGSGGLHKCWHLENFLAVAQKLISKGFEVVFLLGPAEQERFSPSVIDDMKKTAKCLTDLSLTQVLWVLSCSDGFIGNDSGITHLAAGLGVKTIAVFGPTNPALYRPTGPAVTIFAGRAVTFAKRPSPVLQRKLMDVAGKWF